MTYRARTRRRGISVPFVVVLFGVTVVLAGLVVAGLALYLASAVQPAPGGSGDLVFADLLYEPLTVLYRGGAITLGGGSVLMLIGGVFVAASPRR
jgi:hypothetical protein